MVMTGPVGSIIELVSVLALQQKYINNSNIRVFVDASWRNHHQREIVFIFVKISRSLLFLVDIETVVFVAFVVFIQVATLSFTYFHIHNIRCIFITIYITVIVDAITNVVIITV